jgi:hypothetical protein
MSRASYLSKTIRSAGISTVPYAGFYTAAPINYRTPHLTMVLRSVAGFHRAISLHLLLIRDQSIKFVKGEQYSHNL